MQHCDSTLYIKAKCSPDPNRHSRESRHPPPGFRETLILCFSKHRGRERELERPTSHLRYSPVCSSGSFRGTFTQSEGAGSVGDKVEGAISVLLGRRRGR